MDIGALVAALFAAFLVTVLELTEVVALVYALGASSRDMRPGVYGAFIGVAFVSLLTLGTGVAILRFASQATFYLTVVSALILWCFGMFFFRSTVKTYYKEARRRNGLEVKGKKSILDEVGAKALFSGGFSVGCVETLEAMIVLLALSTGGFGMEAVIGFIAGGALLLVLGYLLHEQVRKIKVAPLKWFGSTMIFTFAIFWSGEALEHVGPFEWPTLLTQFPDIFLVPLFVVVLVTVWLAVNVRVQQKLAPDLADVLSNRGKALAEKGDIAGAIPAYRDSVKNYRAMVDSGKEESLQGLAEALNNLGYALGEKGELDEEIASYRESAKIRRSMVEKGKEQFRPDLSRVLNNLGAALGDKGDLDGAAASLKESAEICRSLVDEGSEQYLHDLADVLGNLGKALGDNGDLDGAVSSYRDSVKAYRSLVQGGKDQFQPELADVLSNLGRTLREKKDLDGAIASYRDSEKTYRSLLESGKEQFRPGLSRVMVCLEELLEAKGKTDEAKTLHSEAESLKHTD
jgi:uncharacterized membrane protein